jgi:hypothetical protein
MTEPTAEWMLRTYLPYYNVMVGPNDESSFSDKSGKASGQWLLNQDPIGFGLQICLLKSPTPKPFNYC